MVIRLVYKSLGNMGCIWKIPLSSRNDVGLRNSHSIDVNDFTSCASIFANSEISKISYFTFLAS